MSAEAPGPLFVGVDGGATRARALVVDARGTVLARREGGAAIVRPEDPTAAAATVAALTRATLDDVYPGAIAGVLCCALAGARREIEQGAVRAHLEAAQLAGRILVVTDAEAALHDAFGGSAGILLIGGTGSVAWGRAEDGRTARVGGWGHLLGDEGSAYAVGLAALRSVVRVHDGRAPASRLHARVLEHTGSGAATDLVSWTVHATKAEIAALSRVVAAEAAAGDARAAAIIAEAVAALVELAGALHERLAPWTRAAEIAVTGGLADAEGPLHTQLVAALGADARGFVLRAAKVDAARGAAALARTQPQQLPAG